MTSPFAPLPRDPVPSRADKAYLLLCGIFLGALVVTNAVAGKFFVLFGQPLSCGIIAYPITFLATDLISEVYGRSRANQVVKVGFAVSVFVTGVIWIATRAPAWEGSVVNQESFSNVFSLLPGIVFGSMIAYLTAQFVDVQIFEFWRNLTHGRHLWLRNNGSTMLSQLLDTVMVITIALVVWPALDDNPRTTPLGMTDWRNLVIGQYLFKAGVALLDTPFFYLGTALLKRWIEEDPQGAAEAAATPS